VDPGGALVSVNVGRAVPAPYAARRVRASAIDKRPVDGPVAARALGLEGDQQADKAHHGGAHQAVYAYALEDLRAWGEALARPLRPGQFGENLTTLGVDVTGAVIGERWRIGTALLEVSCPRIPCQTFAGWMDEDDWVRRFTERGAPGTYLRVIEEGRLSKGDDIAVVRRPAHEVTVGEAFRGLTGDRSLAARLLAASELPPKAHDRARAWLGIATEPA
jgi:MOSC domain-containing protein YiiM